MARGRRRVPVSVFLNGRLTGHLNRQASGAIAFQYDDAWLGWEHALPVSLSLPLREDRYIGAPVIAVFDNLLPDSDEIRRRIAERVHAPGIDAYSLLAAIGRDCVGALQFLPDGLEPGPAGAVEAKPVTHKRIAAKPYPSHKRLNTNRKGAPAFQRSSDCFGPGTSRTPIKRCS